MKRNRFLVFSTVVLLSLTLGVAGKKQQHQTKAPQKDLHTAASGHMETLFPGGASYPALLLIKGYEESGGSGSTGGSYGFAESNGYANTLALKDFGIGDLTSGGGHGKATFSKGYSLMGGHGAESVGYGKHEGSFGGFADGFVTQGAGAGGGGYGGDVGVQKVIQGGRGHGGGYSRTYFVKGSPKYGSDLLGGLGGGGSGSYSQGGGGGYSQGGSSYSQGGSSYSQGGKTGGYPHGDESERYSHGERYSRGGGIDIGNGGGGYGGGASYGKAADSDAYSYGKGSGSDAGGQQKIIFIEEQGNEHGAFGGELKLGARGGASPLSSHGQGGGGLALGRHGTGAGLSLRGHSGATGGLSLGAQGSEAKDSGKAIVIQDQAHGSEGGYPGGHHDGGGIQTIIYADHTGGYGGGHRHGGHSPIEFLIIDMQGGKGGGGSKQIELVDYAHEGGYGQGSGYH